MAIYPSMAMIGSHPVVRKRAIRVIRKSLEVATYSGFEDGLSKEDEKRIVHIFNHSKIGKLKRESPITRLVISAHEPATNHLGNWDTGKDFLISSYEKGSDEVVRKSDAFFPAHPAHLIHPCDNGCRDMAYPKERYLMDCLFNYSPKAWIKVWDDCGLPVFYYGAKIERAMYIPADFSHCGNMDFITFFLERYLNPPDDLPSLEKWSSGMSKNVDSKDAPKVLSDLANLRLVKQSSNISSDIRNSESYIRDYSRRAREDIRMARTHRVERIGLVKRLKVIESAPPFSSSMIKEVIHASPDIVDFTLEEFDQLEGGEMFLTSLANRVRDESKLSYKVVVTTRPLPVRYKDRELMLGGFQINLEYDGERGRIVFDRIKIDNLNPLEFDENRLIHPHVHNDGLQCYGTGESEVKKMCEEGDVLNFVLWQIASLKSYNPKSPVHSFVVFERALNLREDDGEDDSVE